MNPQHLHDTPDTGSAIAVVNEAHASGLFSASEEQAMSNSINGIKIYAMNDCDWVVARSREEAITFYRTFSEDAEDWEDAEELSSKALDKLKYATGECLSGPTISFRQRL